MNIILIIIFFNYIICSNNYCEDNCNGCKINGNYKDCTSCLPDFSLSSGFCVKITNKIENCVEYNKDKCIKCITGFGLNYDDKCFKCETENCESCNPNKICTQCSNGKEILATAQLVNCKGNFIKNCSISYNKECQICNKGYGIKIIKSFGNNIIQSGFCFKFENKNNNGCTHIYDENFKICHKCKLNYKTNKEGHCKKLSFKIYKILYIFVLFLFN